MAGSCCKQETASFTGIALFTGIAVTAAIASRLQSKEAERKEKVIEAQQAGLQEEATHDTSQNGCLVYPNTLFFQTALDEDNS